MNAKQKLANVKCFLLDMDGTIYLGDELIGDMKNTLNAIRASGRRIVYLTNNSSKSALAYREKLEQIGIFDEKDGIYTSGMATTLHLNTYFKGKTVYLVGTEALQKEFRECGIPLVEDNADIVVFAFDPTLTYEKLRKTCDMLKKGAYFIATHPDDVCPAPGGSVPDVGSFLEMIAKAANGRRPDVICGKPFEAMGVAVSQYLGLRKDELLMAGDRLNTDIMFGVNNGFFSLLVYSGEATREDYEKSGITVDLALDTLNDIVPYL